MGENDAGGRQSGRFSNQLSYRYQSGADATGTGRLMQAAIGLAHLIPSREGRSCPPKASVERSDMPQLD